MISEINFFLTWNNISCAGIVDAPQRQLGEHHLHMGDTIIGIPTMKLDLVILFQMLWTL